MATLFHEVLFDPDIFTAGGATGGPEFANSLIRNPQTGVFKVNVGRFDPTQVWTMDLGQLEPDDLAYVVEFWTGGFASAIGFRLLVISDFFVIDETFGTGNGSQVIFPLVKSYSRPGSGSAYTRRILKPVTNSLLGGSSVTLFEPNGTTTRAIPTARGVAHGVPAFTIKKNGTTVTNYTIDNTTGIVTFSTAPPTGHVLTWSGEFDTPMRFLQNSLIIKPDYPSQIAGLQFCEILGAELGIV